MRESRSRNTKTTHNPGGSRSPPAATASGSSTSGGLRLVQRLVLSQARLVPTPSARLLDLQPLMRPATWEELMRKLRGQLEQALPLDLELRVRGGRGALEWWQLRGAAQRNEAGQPRRISPAACAR